MTTPMNASLSKTLHLLSQDHEIKIMVLTRGDADTQLQALLGDDDAELTDEEWEQVYEEIDFANEAVMDGVWEMVEHAITTVRKRQESP